MAGLIITKGIINTQDIPNIFTEDKPVIFWDTCSLLYFNTIVGRRAYSEFEWDKKLLDLIIDGKVYSVTSLVVYQEFDKHHEKFKNHDARCENELKAVMKQYGDIIGGQGKIELETGMNALGLSSYLDNMVCELWSQTYVIDADLNFHQKAHNRVLGSLPPSSVKQEYKDCYIWETFLTVCDLLSHRGQAYFMSENKEDYCGKNSKTPLPEIQSDLSIHQGFITISKCNLWVALAKQLGIINQKP